MKYIFFILLIFNYTYIFAKDISNTNKKIENFVFYTVDGKREVFYDMIKSLPINGLVILNFTSIYCKPCRHEIPKLAEIVEKAKTQVILICIYAECGQPVKENASSLNILNSAYVDPFRNIQKQFNVKSFPVTFIISKDYFELKRLDGYTEDNIKMIEEIVLKK